MTKQERERIGPKLKALRIERGLDQIPASRKAGIAVGTLQAIERSKPNVRDTNIEKYARLFGTTTTKLLRPTESADVSSDPRWKDLNDEHLQIARSYMRAKRRLRALIEVLLDNPPGEDPLTNLLLKLSGLPVEQVVELEKVFTAGPELLALLETIYRRLLVDDGYVQVMKDALTVLDQHPIPTAPKPQQQTKATPKRRA